MSGPSISLVATVASEADGSFKLDLRLYDHLFSGVKVRLSKEQLECQLKEPIRLKDCHLETRGEYVGGDLGWNYWIFRNRILIARPDDSITREEFLIHIKHWVLKKEGELDRMRKTIDAFENLEKLPSARREKIPEKVRIFVWQRDEGRCSECGSRENLEFDHIIPVEKGGSSTARNIQLLCEACNRKKSNNL